MHLTLLEHNPNHSVMHCLGTVAIYYFSPKKVYKAVYTTDNFLSQKRFSSLKTKKKHQQTGWKR